MGLISQTLGEILNLTGYDLFENHEICEYPRLIDLIVRKYYNREIAYDTVDYFRMKLNFLLELNAPVYNRMFLAERAEFDPFITEYIDTQEQEASDHEISKAQGISSATTSTDRGTRSELQNTGEQYQHKHETIEYGNATEKEQTADLFSEARNRELNNEENTTLNKTQDTTGKKDTVTDTDTTDHKTVNETGNTTTNKDIEDNYNATKDKVLTDRKWTETGSSQNHDLAVNSRNPQGMLFNTPNHYFGTGRAANFGVVQKDSEGNDYYEPFGEDSIGTIESGPLEINGGDTPWFNYATTAGNNIGRDSYNRSGTESYGQKDTDNRTRTGTEDTTQDKTVDTTSDAKGTKDTTENETHEDHLTSNDTGNKVGSELEANTTNANKHGQSERLSSDNRLNEGQQAYEKTGDLKNKQRTSNRSNTESQSSMSSAETGKNNIITNRLVSGRSGKNPSELLKSYRETLTYSADRWILGELEILFLQLY